MAASRPDTWMPLYIGDYLADTPHLSREQHGSYLLLIFALWRSGGTLPDDDKRLAAIAKASPRQWKEDRDLLAEFFIIEDGVWRHKRVDHELRTAGDFIDQRRGAGKASAEARRRQRHPNETPTTVPTNSPTEQQRDTQREAKTSPSPSPKKDSGKPPPGASPEEQPSPPVAAHGRLEGAAHDAIARIASARKMP